MGNGGHWQKSSEILDNLMKCDVSRIYDAYTIRNMTGDDEG